MSSSIRELVRALETGYRDQCRVEIPFADSTVVLSGEKGNVVKLAEDVLRKVLLSAIDKNTYATDDAQLDEAVKKFYARLADKSDRQAETDDPENTEVHAEKDDRQAVTDDPANTDEHAEKYDRQAETDDPENKEVHTEIDENTDKHSEEEEPLGQDDILSKDKECRIHDLPGTTMQSLQNYSRFTHGAFGPLKKRARPYYSMQGKGNIKDMLESELDTLNHSIKSSVFRQLCKVIIEEEGENCVEAFPAYRKQHKDDPLFVVLSKDKMQGETFLFLGFEIYRRGYEQVSSEAERIAKHNGGGFLSHDDQDRIRKAINTAELHKKHSNITIISASPYKSRKEGAVIEECVCIVIYCLLKGFIPFDEEEFPEEISGIPVDVREGYFQLGVKKFNSKDQAKCVPMMEETNNMSGVQSTTLCYRATTDNTMSKISNEDNIGKRDGDSLSDQTLGIQDAHVGLKSKDFNTRLLMGSCIAALGSGSSGTLGGFVDLGDGRLAALTCYHVVQGSESDAILQPANHSVIATMSAERCVFGKVHTRSKVLKEGSLDKPGVDAATIEITNQDRIPKMAQFIEVQRDQLFFAGFDERDPPKFSRGLILKIDEIQGNDRRSSVLKFGAESGLTVGHLHLNGAYVHTGKEKMLMPQTGENHEFFGQLEVFSIKGPSTDFFELGDSGALLFMPIKDKELHCIGLCIGRTNYSSCIVTPIENIFAELKIKGFKNFTGGNSFI